MKKELKIEPMPLKATKYQVRFWTSPEAYKSFKEKCDNNGVNLQDAFNQFIDWYVSE